MYPRHFLPADKLGTRSLILSYLLIWKPLGYLIVALGMIIEGDVILFSAAFLTHERFFNIWAMFPLALASVLIGDVLWYLLGANLEKIYLIHRLEQWIKRITERFDEHLKERTGRTLFISKFTYGFGHLMVVRAGMLGLKPKEFFQKNISATVAWALIVWSLGYFSSTPFLFARRYLHFTERALLIAVLTFFLLEYIFSRFWKKKL